MTPDPTQTPVATQSPPSSDPTTVTMPEVVVPEHMTRTESDAQPLTAPLVFGAANVQTEAAESLPTAPLAPTPEVASAVAPDPRETTVSEGPAAEVEASPVVIKTGDEAVVTAPDDSKPVVLSSEEKKAEDKDSAVAVLGKHRESKKSKHPRKESPIITLEMVSKTYGEDPLDYKALIIKNIYLEIFEGEFMIVFGPSGSGKSTILNLMAGLEMPTAGRVLVRKKNIASFPSDELARYHRLRMGMVFQNFNLIKSLNVWENVALPQTANGVNYNTRKKRALKLLKLLNIDHYANRHPNEISGGEQQRVAIARALINNPYFLLVDEPTGNLDSKSAEDVMHLLYELNQHAQHTIVLVTHNPNHLHYASRVVYVEDGKIIIEEKRDAAANDLPQKLGDATYQHLQELREEA